MARFVKAQPVRLYLVDVYKRIRADLMARYAASQAKDVKDKDLEPLLERIAAIEVEVEYATELGDFIDVKRRLNTGESQELYARMLPYQTPGEKVSFETRALATTRVLAYLLGWSFKDDDSGEPVAFDPDMPDAERLSLIQNLDPDTFFEIKEAIDWHADNVQKEIDALKKRRAGLLEPATT